LRYHYNHPAVPKVALDIRPPAGPSERDVRAMDLAKALADLRQQRDHLDQAILSLERLASGQPRRRGRPPGRTNNTAKKRPTIPAPRSGDGVRALD